MVKIKPYPNHISLCILKIKCSLIYKNTIFYAIVACLSEKWDICSISWWHRNLILLHTPVSNPPVKLTYFLSSQSIFTYQQMFISISVDVLLKLRYAKSFNLCIFFKLSRNYQYISEYQEPPMGYCSRDYKEIKKHFSKTLLYLTNRWKPKCPKFHT